MNKITKQEFKANYDNMVLITACSKSKEDIKQLLLDYHNSNTIPLSSRSTSMFTLNGPEYTCYELQLDNTIYYLIEGIFDLSKDRYTSRNDIVTEVTLYRLEGVK